MNKELKIEVSFDNSLSSKQIDQQNVLKYTNKIHWTDRQMHNFSSCVLVARRKKPDAAKCFAIVEMGAKNLSER